MTDVVTVPPADSPARTRRIDLDAARAARREARGDEPAPVVVIDGEELELPHELPASALGSFGLLFALSEGDDGDADPGALDALETATADLFGPAWPALKAKGISLEDLLFLLEQALALYGFSLPESEASGASS